jgi:predicted enzyme related to lactoylglutathione lyase
MRIVSALHVRVKDLDRGKAFYEELLGIHLTRVNDEVCNGKLGDFTLVLQKGEPMQRAAVAFVVDDLVSSKQKAEALGGKPNVSGYAAVQAMIIDDPDGNHLEFVAMTEDSKVK